VNSTASVVCILTLTIPNNTLWFYLPRSILWNNNFWQPFCMNNITNIYKEFSISKNIQHRPYVWKLTASTAWSCCGILVTMWTVLLVLHKINLIQFSYLGLCLSSRVFSSGFRTIAFCTFLFILTVKNTNY